MADPADIASAVDQFLRTPKLVIGPDVPLAWGAGLNEFERMVRYPLEMGGEQTGAQLFVIGFPSAPSVDFLKFRIGILYPGAVCRLDYTDETHPNAFSEAGDNLPPIVRGPHYHSWRVNRRFCRGGCLPHKLHNAEPFVGGPSFDSILRWFCADNLIEGLPPNHRIELPIRTMLL